MLTSVAICLLLGLQGQNLVHPLGCLGKMSLPVYPNLAKSAHDSRLIKVKTVVVKDHLDIIEISGGNKYFDKSIRQAISTWIISEDHAQKDGSVFDLSFDFKMSGDPTKEGLCEIDFTQNKITVWGLKRYTDTEQLPTATQPPK